MAHPSGLVLDTSKTAEICQERGIAVENCITFASIDVGQAYFSTAIFQRGTEDDEYDINSKFRLMEIMIDELLPGQAPQQPIFEAAKVSDNYKRMCGDDILDKDEAVMSALAAESSSAKKTTQQKPGADPRGKRTNKHKKSRTTAATVTTSSSAASTTTGGFNNIKDVTLAALIGRRIHYYAKTLGVSVIFVEDQLIEARANRNVENCIVAAAASLGVRVFCRHPLSKFQFQSEQAQRLIAKFTRQIQQQNHQQQSNKPLTSPQLKELSLMIMNAIRRESVELEVDSWSDFKCIDVPNTVDTLNATIDKSGLDKWYHKDISDAFLQGVTSLIAFMAFVAAEESKKRMEEEEQVGGGDDDEEEESRKRRRMRRAIAAKRTESEMYDDGK